MPLRILLAAACSAALAACGSGGDSRPEFRSVVSFGDSLSDVGTYRSITGPAGGKFTINPGSIWVENIASRLGLALTPYLVGYGTDASTWQICPQAACTGYAQGGARITDPLGIGNTEGALTQPLRVQIANHLAMQGGRFRQDELVLVFGGANDVLAQYARYGQLAPGIGPAAAQAEAEANMAVAARELVSYLQNDILGKGARHVTVVNLPPLSQTPLGQTAGTAQGRAVLDALTDVFNATLTQGIGENRLDLLVYDAHSAFQAIAADPARYGLVNTRDAACDPLKISALTNGVFVNGSALFCNESTLTESARAEPRYQFADSVHPTPLTHRIFSDLVIQALTERGWL